MNGFFDNNATTPLSRAARDAWLEAAEKNWYNPSSLYLEAAAAKHSLEDAREELAGMLGCEADWIVFNSGATEANNAVFERAAESDRIALISAIEHPSVREPARLRFTNEHVDEISVSPGGSIELEHLTEKLRGDGPAPFVSVMAANNETGVLQPWKEAAALCREHGAPFHCDAAQWIGKLPAGDFGEACDFITGSAHKFGGPKGVGFLVVPDGDESFRSTVGGPQESGRRAGTEDLPGILGMMAALRERNDEIHQPDFLKAKTADRSRFESSVREKIPGLEIIAPDSDRLWNTVMLVVPDHKNLKWLTRLSRRGFQVSTGSACSAGRENPSHVMQSMGLDFDRMGRVIRISGGWETESGDWDALAEAFEEVYEDLNSAKRDAGTLLS